MGAWLAIVKLLKSEMLLAASTLLRIALE